MNITKVPKPQIIEYYNQGSKINDTLILTNLYKKYLNAEEEFLKKTIPGMAKVIEIGAGNGRIIDCLNNGKRKITGVEIANLSFLKEKYKNEKNVQIRKADAHNLNLIEKEKFDTCLIMYNTLGLMRNPLKVLKECKKIVRENGKIIISTYTTNAKYALKERIKCFTKIGHRIMKVNGFDFTIDNGIASHYFTKEELEKLFENAKVTQIYYPLTKLGCIWIIEIQ